MGTSAAYTVQISIEETIEKCKIISFSLYRITNLANDKNVKINELQKIYKEEKEGIVNLLRAENHNISPLLKDLNFLGPEFAHVSAFLANKSYLICFIEDEWDSIFIATSRKRREPTTKKEILRNTHGIGDRVFALTKSGYECLVVLANHTRLVRFEIFTSFFLIENLLKKNKEKQHFSKIEFLKSISKDAKPIKTLNIENAHEILDLQPWDIPNDPEKKVKKDSHSND